MNHKQNHIFYKKNAFFIFKWSKITLDIEGSGINAQTMYYNENMRIMYRTQVYYNL